MVVRSALSLLLGMWGSVAAANEIPPSLLPILLEKQSTAEDFASQAEACVARTDSHHTLFHGCVDWHSSVHGNWAILAFSNAALNFETAQPQPDWLKSESGLQQFDTEIQYLVEHPKFELPYGRAWLLRLAIEADIAFPEDNIGARTEPIFRDLLAYASDDTLDPLSGSYSSLSWALINLYDYAEHFKKENAVSTVAEIILARYLKLNDLECDYDRERGSFMAICTNWAMAISRVLPRAEFDSWLDRFVSVNGLPSSVSDPVGSHEFGLNFSRAWGLWSMYDLSEKSRPDVVDAFSDHFEMGYSQYKKISNDYYLAGHWVAQFGMFTLQPLLGRK